MESICFYALIAVTCTVFVPLTADSNTIEDIDRDLFRYIHEDMDNGFLDTTLPIVQLMGDPAGCIGIPLFLCAFGDERMFETGKLASAAVIEAGSVTHLLKVIIGRPRPLAKTEKNSFPSGHTTAAFALATVAGYKYPKLRIPLYISAFGTAFARVYLGRHYPTDVIAGAIIGILAGIHINYSKGYILKLSF